MTEDQKALYSQRVEEIVPNIRYCAYNIGDMPSDITELMKMRTDTPGYDMLASKIDVSGLAMCGGERGEGGKEGVCVGGGGGGGGRGGMQHRKKLEEITIVYS